MTQGKRQELGIGLIGAALLILGLLVGRADNGALAAAGQVATGLGVLIVLMSLFFLAASALSRGR